MTESVARFPLDRAHDHKSIELEQAMLGAILLNNQAYLSVSEFLDGDDFSEAIHIEIYDICSELINDGKLATPLTVGPFLADLDVAPGISKAKYLARLCAEATSVVNSKDYGQAIRDLADQRRVAAIGAMLQHPRAADPGELAAEGIQALDAMVARRTVTGAPSLNMPEAVARAIDATAAAYQRDGHISGLPSGLKDLDARTLGFQRCELVILAGRPGMGKTALAWCFARAMAEAGHRGLFVSLEMGDISITQRALSDLIYDTNPIPYWLFRSGRFKSEDFDRIVDAGRHLGSLPIRIEQQPNLSIAQIGARARQMKKRGGLDYIVVDHIHLVRASNRYAGNAVKEVGETTSSLKALAKELDVAIIGLCQLNRGVESRDDRRPNLGDLRGSGEIEQDADTVIMLYREAYYLARKEPIAGSEERVTWEDRMNACSNALDALVEKQRNGPIGAVKLFCDVASNAIRDTGWKRDISNQERFDL